MHYFYVTAELLASYYWRPLPQVCKINSYVLELSLTVQLKTKFCNSTVHTLQTLSEKTWCIWHMGRIFVTFSYKMDCICIGPKWYGLWCWAVYEANVADPWLAEVFTICTVVEFFNGHNTDKAHPFIEDCIAKQQPLVKVTVFGVPCLLESVIYATAVLHVRIMWLASMTSQ